MQKLWTIAELAIEWRVSYEWVRRRLKSGELRGLRLSPRGPWRIPDDEVSGFYNAQASWIESAAAADAADGDDQRDA